MKYHIAGADALDLEGVDGRKVVGTYHQQTGLQLLLLSTVPRPLGGLHVDKLEPAELGALEIEVKDSTLRLDLSNKRVVYNLTVHVFLYHRKGQECVFVANSGSMDGFII